MVRRVLSVLALLPLLLPPGLCVCHAPGECAGGAAGRLGGRTAPAAPFRLAHRCHGDNRASSDSSGGSHRHAPGCPALGGVDRGTAPAEVAVRGLAPDLAGLVFLSSADDTSPSAHSLTPSLGAPSGPVPLYLALRTFLI